MNDETTCFGMAYESENKTKTFFPAGTGVLGQGGVGQGGSKCLRS